MTEGKGIYSENVVLFIGSCLLFIFVLFIGPFKVAYSETAKKRREKRNRKREKVKKERKEILRFFIYERHTHTHTISTQKENISHSSTKSLILGLSYNPVRRKIPGYI